MWWTSNDTCSHSSVVVKPSLKEKRLVTTLLELWCNTEKHSKTFCWIKDYWYRLMAAHEWMAMAQSTFSFELNGSDTAGGANVLENGGYVSFWVIFIWRLTSGMDSHWIRDAFLASYYLFLHTREILHAFKVVDRTHPFEEKVHVLRFGVDD